MKRYTDSTKPQSRCTSPGTERLVPNESLHRQLSFALLQLEEAKQTIKKLRADKAALKSALADTVKKRNQLFTELGRAYNQLEHKTVKSQNSTKTLRSLKTAVAKRDSVIRHLQESLTNYGTLLDTIQDLSTKAKRIPVTYALFKAEIGCGRAIELLLKHNDWAGVAGKLASFASKLIEELGADPMHRVSKLNQDISASIQRARDLVYGIEQDTIVTLSHESSFLEFIQGNA